ncbi:MAG: RHS domain-containing protein [Deltaproteobacteria bacterium]|nr:RHS domain-containing protein [Deltaproteobacteria bacterium]
MPANDLLQAVVDPVPAGVLLTAWLSAGCLPDEAPADGGGAAGAESEDAGRVRGGRTPQGGGRAGGGGPAAQGGKLGDPIYYFHNDALGTPVRMTDERGATVWRAEYKSFGDLNRLETDVDGDGTHVEQPLRFPGQSDDALSSLLLAQGPYYNWNRFYEPATGRYLALEPMLVRPGFARSMAAKGLSPPSYAYALNNPVSYVDPDGLRAYAVWCPAVGGFERGFSWGPVTPLAKVGGFRRTPGSVSFNTTGVDPDPDSACADLELAKKLRVIGQPETLLALDCWDRLLDDIRAECEAEKKRKGPRPKQVLPPGTACAQ